MKGILFTHLNYILSVYNHKTATRRGPERLTQVINPNPNEWQRPQIETIPSDFDGLKHLTIDGTYAVFRKLNHAQGDLPECIKFRFEVGEIAYVQEPVRILTESDFAEGLTGKMIKHPKTGAYVQVIYEYLNEKLPSRAKEKKYWQNKMFMNPAYARYYVKFTAINIERLFDISDNDCFREGIMKSSLGGYGMFDFKFNQVQPHADLPHLVYHKIWDEINGKGTAVQNPYVFAYDYVLHDNLAELQSLDVELFKPFPYLYADSETNHLSLTYDCTCGLDESWLNFGKVHPRWKDIADALIEHAFEHRIDGLFLINHVRFSYGVMNKNQRLPLPERVKEYAKVAYLKETANKTTT